MRHEHKDTASARQTSNVTSLRHYMPQRLPIRHEGTRRMFRLWESLRGERSAPDKDELPLTDLGALLPWLGLIEPDDSGRQVWRLAGSGLAMLIGAGLEGQEAFRNWERFERETLQRMLGNVSVHAQPFVAQLALHDETGELAVELSGFPLRDRLLRTRLALVLMLPLTSDSVLFGPACRARLLGLRTIWTTPIPGGEGSLSAPRPAGAHGFAPFTVIPGGRDR